MSACSPYLTATPCADMTPGRLINPYLPTSPGGFTPFVAPVLEVPSVLPAADDELDPGVAFTLAPPALVLAREVDPVPEPSLLLLMGLACAVVCVRRRAR